MDINELLEVYAPDDSIFSEESEEIRHLKHIIFNELSEPARRILLLYAELGSLRKVGAELGVSATTAYWYIKAVRDEIKEKLSEDEHRN